MTPYRLLGWLWPRQQALLLCSLVALLITAAAADESGQKTEAAGTTNTKFHYATAQNNALTGSGFEHYYDLDYDAAIRDFERVLAEQPGDPFAVNHLTAALLFRELYRAGALETGLYTGNGFVNEHAPIKLDARLEARIKELMAKAVEQANQRITANPNDAQAYYARGVAHGLDATYTAVVRKAWFAALGSAKAARRDHEKALELEPSYSDARLVVGMQSYIVGSLPWAVRVLAHAVGESGNKEQGMKDIQAAANGGGEAGVDAKVVLGLFLRREQRYKEALDNERSLTAAHAHNFLFALEEANILKDWGKGPEAVAAYRTIISRAKAGEYHGPQLEFADYGLGEALRGQNDFDKAAEAYDDAAKLPDSSPDIRLRAALWAGEMYDLLQKRDLAIQRYQNVIAQNADSEEAEVARRNLKEPYRN